jgi:hypothetical protein
MSELFPELDRDLVQHILRNGVRLKAEDTTISETLQYLLNLSIITIQEHRYVRCAYRDDYDFLEREVLDCPGRVELDPAGEDYYCPECGEPIGNVERKTVFIEYEVNLSPGGIETYLDHLLNSLESVTEVAKVGFAAFDLQIHEGMPLTVVVPEYSEIRHRFAGLFFAEPMLYIIASPINEPVTTVLDKRQYLQLADFLSNAAHRIEESIKFASVPISGRRSLVEVEAKFDEMLARRGKQAWQFFEQDFIPALVLHITENPALVQEYLESLRRLSGTIFGEYYVPIGGAGRTDLRPINKYEMMNQLFAGNLIGDAKCYISSSLAYDDVREVNFHLDVDPTKPAAAMISVAGDSIVSTAWNAAMELRQRYGFWRIIIITKYLLLEIIYKLGAVYLLDM